MSTEVYEITANAKINLFLRVTGRLPNGYHKLYSIMQEIGISDDLKITVGEGTSGIEVVCLGRADIEPEHNLCYKAADRFLSKLKKKTLSEGNSFTSPHIRIDLTKNIPSESGMGGGSSDAAAVLMVMQEHFDAPFTEEELAGIAVNVGADVPFFLYGGTCLCEMVGEQITPLNHLEGLSLVIAKPEGGVSTPLCFKMIDSNPLPDFDEGAYAGFVNELDSRIGKGEDVLPFIAANEDLLINDLQAPGIECIPEIATIIQRFKDNGAAYTAMTGSGSAVFAMFPDKESAKSCADKLKEDPDGSKWMLIVTETI